MDRGQQPASLAEFNFDSNDSAAPWYDVSYVDAISLAITIEPRGGGTGQAAGTCVRADCSGSQLLSACPAENAQYDQRTGDRIPVREPEPRRSDRLHTGTRGVRPKGSARCDRSPAGRPLASQARRLGNGAVFAGGLPVRMRELPRPVGPAGQRVAAR
jgi:hypothetical protein